MNKGKSGLAALLHARKAAPRIHARGREPVPTLIGRVRSLRKKDAVFVLAGLSTLVMTPVAEHLLLSQSTAGPVLEQGFDRKGPLFADGGSVYEAGTGGFAPGGLIGPGHDVITPLNVRDPAALIMGPGNKSRKGEDDSGKKWKEALSQSVGRGAKAAVEKAAKLPTPSEQMQGALRGLAALEGASGSGAGYAPQPLSAANVPNRARPSQSLTRSQAVPGFKGTHSRGIASRGAEDLRMAARKQADILNRAGSAVKSLEAAAGRKIPKEGGFGPGRPGPRASAGESKSPRRGGIKDNRSLGESLEFLRRKIDVEKGLGLKWKKREWSELGRKRMLFETGLKMLAGFITKAFSEPISEIIKRSLTRLASRRGKPDIFQCITDSGSKKISSLDPAVKHVDIETKVIWIDVGPKQPWQKIQCLSLQPLGGLRPRVRPGDGGPLPAGIRTGKTLDGICGVLEGAGKISELPGAETVGGAVKSGMLKASRELAAIRNNMGASEDWSCALRQNLLKAPLRSALAGGSLEQALRGAEEALDDVKRDLLGKLERVRNIAQAIKTGVQQKAPAVYAPLMKQSVSPSDLESAIRAMEPLGVLSSQAVLNELPLLDKDLGPSEGIPLTLRETGERVKAMENSIRVLGRRLDSAKAALARAVSSRPGNSNVRHYSADLGEMHAGLERRLRGPQAGGSMQSRFRRIKREYNHARKALKKTHLAVDTLRAEIGGPPSAVSSRFGTPVAASGSPARSVDGWARQWLAAEALPELRRISALAAVSAQERTARAQAVGRRVKENMDLAASKMDLTRSRLGARLNEARLALGRLSPDGD